MKPAPFTYHRPGSLAEALEMLAEHAPAAKPLAGGQSLGPMLNMRLARPAHLVDMNDLIELDYLRRGEGVLEIGALTRQHRLVRAPEIRQLLPLLAEAASTIGHYAIRQRGTVGGSLAHADPAAQLPLLCVALDGEVVIRSQRGGRTAKAADFLQSIMTVDLADDELVTAIRLPLPAAGIGWSFELFARRRGDFAVASVVTLVGLDAGEAVDRLTIAVGGVGAVPLRLKAIEAGAIGARADAAWIDTMAETVAAEVSPEDEPLMPGAFRQDILRKLVRNGLTAALERCKVPHAS